MKGTASDGYLYLSEAGVITGFGHLTRLSALAEATPQGRSSARVCILDDTNESLFRAKEISELDTEFLSAFVEFKHLYARTEAIFVDGHRIEIDSLGLKNIKLCVVMSPLLRQPGFRTASFFRGKDLPSKWNPKKGDIIELGVEYSVVSNEILSLRKVGNQVSNSLNEHLVVTLMIGESSDKAIWQRVNRIITELSKFESIKLQIPQKTVGKLSELLNQESRYPIQVVQYGQKYPWTQILNTNLVVATAGQAMVESMCLGFPTIPIPIHLEQCKFVQEMQTLGAVIPAIKDDGESCEIVEIVQNARNHHFRADVSKNAMEAVDGLGAKRIHEIISRLLE